MRKKEDYHDWKRILKKCPNSTWYVVIGERSNGKTYGYTVEYALKERVMKNNETIAYIRRLDDDITKKNLEDFFSSAIKNGVLKNYKWNNVYYYGRKWYFCNTDESGKIIEKCSNPFMYCFSLQKEQQYKSGFSMPDCKTIIYDEFLTRDYYLKDEFIKLTNLVSTIVRLKDDVKIFMLANTVNFDSPYWQEMGINNIKNIPQGSITQYSYGNSGMTLALEYCKKMGGVKNTINNKYFAFENPRLKMIKDGTWEIDNYQHLPCRKAELSIINDNTFIIFNDNTLKLNVFINPDLGVGVLVEPFYNEPKAPDRIYSNVLNYTKIIVPFFDTKNNFDKNILQLYKNGKFYYATNTVGEIFNNFMKWANHER